MSSKRSQHLVIGEQNAGRAFRIVRVPYGGSTSVPDITALMADAVDL
ncbi:MAG: hypothetical protein ABI432_02410 [Flavobacteriales bacterium]